LFDIKEKEAKQRRKKGYLFLKTSPPPSPPKPQTKQPLA
jgi:hypothetical protein